MPSSRTAQASRKRDEEFPESGNDNAGEIRRRDWLARGLKKLYEDTLNDPVPDSFLHLLEELDRKDKEKNQAADAVKDVDEKN